MSKTKTVSWTPFAAAGMTVEQTRNQILWAMDQWGLVCGLRFVSATGKQGDVTIRGANTDAWAGYTSGRNISISTIRNMTGRLGYILGGVIIHELGHTQGLPHTPQTDEYRDYCMHPWGPSDDWWAPEEVRQLQKKFGMPAADFQVHEITYWGTLLRGNRAKINQMIEQKQTWIAAREKATSQAAIDKLTKQIETQDKALNTLRTQSRGWKSIYAQKIVRWSDAKIPRAIVPQPTRHDKIAAEVIEFRTLRYRSTDHICGHDSAEKVTIEPTAQEPIQ